MAYRRPLPQWGFKLFAHNFRPGKQRERLCKGSLPRHLHKGIPFSHHPDPDRENQVKSHLAWIYAHSRMRVKYKVVPKGYGISCVKVEEAPNQEHFG